MWALGRRGDSKGCGPQKLYTSRCGSPRLYATPFRVHVTLLRPDQTSNSGQSLTSWKLLIAKGGRLDGILANDTVRQGREHELNSQPREDRRTLVSAPHRHGSHISDLHSRQA